MSGSLPDPLREGLAALHEGDVDAVEELCHEEVEFTPNVGEPSLVGRDAVESYFLAYGGRRERFEVLDVVDGGEVLAVRWALHFRADAGAYSHHGWARLEIVDGTIARWDALWTEVETDTSHWAGD